MLRIIPAVLAVCFVASPVRAEPHCESLDVSRVRLQQAAKVYGGGALVLDGDLAHRFLDVVNHVGDPTDWSSDHVGVMVLPAQGIGLVVKAASPECGYGPEALRMPLSVIIKAYRVARGDPA